MTEKQLRFLPGNDIEFDYTNYKGERAFRRVMVIEVFYGTTPHHEGAQLFLLAYDFSKSDYRTFAMKDIHFN